MLANRLIVSWWVLVILDLPLRSTGGAAVAADALVAGWSSDSHNTGLPAIWWMLMICMVMIRFAAYRLGRRPPISLWGRVRTGRLVIPRYDVMWVTPVLLLVYAAAAPRLLSEMGIPHSILVGVLFFGALVLLRFGPPSQQVWDRTGQYHFASSDGEKQAEQHALMQAKLDS